MTLSSYMQKAIITGNVNAVKRFLWLHRGNRLAINARTDQHGRFMASIDGNTALTLAIKSDQFTIAKLLIASPDVDVNKCDAKGYTPLMLAAQFQDLNIVNLLLERKDINLEAQTPAHGNTALFSAQKYGSRQIVKALLRKGANADHRNKYGLTAKDGAVDKNMISIHAKFDCAFR